MYSRTLNLYIKYLTLLFFIGMSFISFSQQKISFSIEIGTGIQIIKTKIPNSKNIVFNSNLTPKPFLGFGINSTINKQLDFEFNINSNTSSFETEINYFNDSDHISYFSRLRHNDINYGVSSGLKYTPKTKDNRIFTSGGFKFQLISVQSYFSEFRLQGGYDSSKSVVLESFNSNDFSRKYNSFGYFFNIGYKLGKNKNYDLILEITGSFNKPIFGSNEIFYNGELIEKVVYKRNLTFSVLKLRKIF